VTIIPLFTPDTMRRRLDMKFLLFRISILLKYLTFKNSIRKKLHCNRGYHNFFPGYHKSTNSKGVSLEVRYLKCKNCQILFFITPEDKDIYKRLNESEVDKLGDFMKYAGLADKKPPKKLQKIKVLK
jgi:hypothetical protein